MNIDAVISRAYAATGQGIRYKLGKGGFKPGHPLPDSGGLCDCSGFVSWCLGMNRQTQEAFYKHYNGGWIETTAVWTDIGKSVGIFEQRDGPVRGSVVVFPDANGSQGHIGIVTGPDTVIHCSKSNDNRLQDSIAETDFRVFNRSDVRFGWLVGLSQ